MRRILLIEDDLQAAKLVVYTLQDEQYLVDHAEDGEMAREYLANDVYDLILLDWNLPDTSGIDILKAYRLRGGVKPVLMLTGQASTENKLTGFDSGADDYLTKPYELKELLARVRALLRRPAQMLDDILKVGDLEYSCQNKVLKVRGQEVKLAPRELSLLEHFMRYPGELFSAEILLAKVWGYSDDASPDALRTSIRRVRAAIDPAESEEPSLIENVSKMGYRLRK